MGLYEFLLLIIVAGICGAIGQAISGVSSGGCLASVVLGLIGAVLGIWVADALGLPTIISIKIGTTPFPILWSVVGSALFVAILSLFTGRRR